MSVTKRAALVALPLLLSASVAGCGSVVSDPGAIRPLPSSSSTSNAASGARDLTVPSVKATPQAIDPVAPTSYRPVRRGRDTPHPSVTASVGTLSSSSRVAYADGVTLTVIGIKQGVETGAGPGMFPGRPHTAITLRLENKSSKPIDLSQVVVTTTYGKPARIAAPVYNDESAVDFFGPLRPSGSATATYLFAVPVDQLSRVTTLVDFDAVHAAARFTGSAK
jgi:hypothetical protein